MREEERVRELALGKRKQCSKRTPSSKVSAIFLVLPTHCEYLAARARVVSVGFEAVGVGLAATKGMSARSAVARTVNCMAMLC